MGEYSGTTSYFVKHDRDIQTQYNLRAVIEDAQCVFLVQISSDTVHYVNDISALEGNVRCYDMEYVDNKNLWISPQLWNDSSRRG